MSVSSKVNAFLERAKTLTNIYSAKDSVQQSSPRPARTQPLKNSLLFATPKTVRSSPLRRLSPRKVVLKPTSKITLRSTLKTPRPPPRSPAKLQHRQPGFPQGFLRKLDVFRETSQLSRFQAHLAVGAKTLGGIATDFGKQTQQNRRVSTYCSQRIAALMKLVTQEALQLDRHLDGLQQRNAELGLKFASSPKNSQQFITKWAANKQAQIPESTDPKLFVNASTDTVQTLCWHILQEEEQRLQAEEHTSRVLAEKERVIAALEQQLAARRRPRRRRRG